MFSLNRSSDSHLYLIVKSTLNCGGKDSRFSTLHWRAYVQRSPSALIRFATVR